MCPLCLPFSRAWATPATPHHGRRPLLSFHRSPRLGNEGADTECLRTFPSCYRLRDKARAEGPREGHLSQASPRSLFPPLPPCNRAQNPKRWEHWGTPRQSPRWTESSRSGMKPLPSERQLPVGVAGAVPAHPQGSVRLEEGRGKAGIPGRNATPTAFCVTRQGLWPYLPTPRGPASDL